MYAHDFLNEARAIIEDRDSSYGDPTNNLQRTASLWSAYLDLPIAAEQVAICLALVKISRSVQAPKVDNYIDGASYIAIAGEIGTEENDLYV